MRAALAIAVVSLLVSGAAGLLHARDRPRVAERRAGDCREWLAAKGYRHEIASVRKLVPRMKRALAAPGLSVAIAAGGKLV
jgi:hypothetical protein